MSDFASLYPTYELRSRHPARDLAGLIQVGYRLAEVKFVDMFPQTAHQETMVRLERE